MVDFSKRLERPPLPGAPVAAEAAADDGVAEVADAPGASSEAVRPGEDGLEHALGLPNIGSNPVPVTVEESADVEDLATLLAGDASGADPGLDATSAPDGMDPTPEAVGTGDHAGAGADGDADAVEADAIPDDDQEPTSPPDEPQFLYIAGTAGTGKSYLARQRAEQYTDAVLTASTGIAAVNVGGTTINSILGYYDTDSLQTEYEFGRLNVRLKRLVDSGYRRLLIDEISMMDGRQLDILCLAIDEVNEGRADGKQLGLTLVGDFAQLPPVKAPFVFERPSWERFEPHTILLTEPRRQADPDFVRALQAVRRGDKKAATEYFAPMLHQSEDRRFEGTCILAKNDEVERYNKIRMFDLPGPEHKFTATRTGEQAKEWKNIPDTLVLKPNCLVMCLANKKEQGFEGHPGEIIYANGDLAHFIRPQIPDHPMSAAIVKLLRNGREVVVERVAREKKAATGAKGVKKERETKEGSIVYMPLRVAYASTVHKSQGLSLDNVQVMINSQFFMTAGMLYVALSRARTPQGLRIVGSAAQFAARVRSNALIQRWL